MIQSIRTIPVLSLGFILGVVLANLSQASTSIEQNACRDSERVHPLETSKGKSRFSPLPTNALLEGWDRHLVNGHVEVPKKFWGSFIRELQPVRVVIDLVNVAVVTAENKETLRGVYFVRAESSYLPINAEDRIFNWNSCTEMLEFVFNKSKPQVDEG